jgi:hypothetical protein
MLVSAAAAPRRSDAGSTDADVKWAAGRKTFTRMSRNSIVREFQSNNRNLKSDAQNNKMHLPKLRAGKVPIHPGWRGSQSDQGDCLCWKKIVVGRPLLSSIVRGTGDSSRNRAAPIATPNAAPVAG